MRHSYTVIAPPAYRGRRRKATGLSSTYGLLFRYRLNPDVLTKKSGVVCDGVLSRHIPVHFRFVINNTKLLVLRRFVLAQLVIGTQSARNLAHPPDLIARSWVISIQR